MVVYFSYYLPHRHSLLSLTGFRQKFTSRFPAAFVAANVCLTLCITIRMAPVLSESDWVHISAAAAAQPQCSKLWETHLILCSSGASAVELLLAGVRLHQLWHLILDTIL